MSLPFSLWRWCAAVFVLSAIGTDAGFLLPVNNDFSSGLLAWSADGDVSVTSDEAAVGESRTTRSKLYQGFPFSVGPVLVDFDFKGNLSSDGDAGSFADTFVASLFFINDLPSFDLDGNTSDNTWSLDLTVPLNGGSGGGNGGPHFPPGTYTIEAQLSGLTGQSPCQSSGFAIAIPPN